MILLFNPHSVQLVNDTIMIAICLYLFITKLIAEFFNGIKIKSKCCYYVILIQKIKVKFVNPNIFVPFAYNATSV